MNVLLSSANEDDNGFLYRVYASTREEELKPAGWAAEQLESFLRIRTIEPIFPTPNFSLFRKGSTKRSKVEAGIMYCVQENDLSESDFGEQSLGTSIPSTAESFYKERLVNQSTSKKHMSLLWQEGHVSPEERANLLGQCPATLWLTGLSGSGKSTLAFELERRFVANGRACYVLDGDNVRHGLNRDLGFTAVARSENIRRVAEVAKLMNDAGLIVITAFISPYRSDRKMAQQIIGADKFLEVHLSTPIAACELRDVKGMYKKARSGEIADFTGISAPYELPLNPAASIDTSVISVEDALKLLYKIISLSSVKKYNHVS